MHDATELVKMMEPGTMEKVTSAILIDQGDGDTFYADATVSGTVRRGSEKNVKPGFVKYNVREGYDHSYWFISTFAETTLIFTRRI